MLRLTATNILALLLLCFACNNDDEAALELSSDISSSCDVPQPIDTKDAVSFGDGTPQSCTQAALQQLITNGGKIKCNCGSSPFTLKLTSTLEIPRKEVILDGNNLFTLDGNNAVLIFIKLSAANQDGGSLLVLQNMKLINGRVPTRAHASDFGGAAIASRGAFGSLKLFNVTFENNVSAIPDSEVDSKGRPANADACGAIHTILYKEVLLVNCTFRNNKGSNGGAIGTIGSSTTIYNSVFENNEATGKDGTFALGGIGGAVYVDGVHQNGVNNVFRMCGVTIRNNKAGHEGGGVYVNFYDGKGSTAKVNQSHFENNQAAKSHGGGYMHLHGPLELTNSTFNNNQTVSLGGALFTSNTRLTVVNSTFFKNTSTKSLGGAIAFDGNGASFKDGAIINCTFAENKAGVFASAVQNTGELTLINNLFVNNLTGVAHQSNPLGGATINKGGSLTIGEGNLQFPDFYTTTSNNRKEDWINNAVLTVDPLLQPLTDNGGPTPTMALGANSPAVNAGTGNRAPSVDQRGKARRGNVDIGAYEVDQ